MKTIIEMARKAGFQIDGDSWIHAGVVLTDGRKAIDEQLVRFAEIVRAGERDWLLGYIQEHQPSNKQIVDAIRARSNT